MKKILVPSDLSEISAKALELAVTIAEKTQGHIDLVNFHKHPYGKSFSATGEMGKKVSDRENIFNLELIKKNYQSLTATAHAYNSKKFSIEAQVYDEDFDEGMKQFITDHDIDLVVIGTSGEENIEEFFTGNHAQQIIESAPCPVITVRSEDDLGDLSKIVLGVEFKKDMKDNYLKAIAYINELAASLEAKVYLVHYAGKEDKDSLQKKLKEFADDYGLLNYETALVDGHSEREALLAYGHQLHAGAVAVLTHADGGFFRAFESNLSEEMNKNADLPVLTVNLHKI